MSILRAALPVLGGELGFISVAFDRFSECLCGAWRHHSPEWLLEWQTDNVHYVTDIDTPEDLSRWAGRLGSGSGSGQG